MNLANKDKEQLAVIREHFIAGAPLDELAARFGVPLPTLEAVARRDFWQHDRNGFQIQLLLREQREQRLASFN